MSILNKVARVSIHVNDIEKAVHFYRDVLGLNMILYLKERNIARFQIGDFTLGLHVKYPEEGGRDPGGATGIIFESEDINKTLEELRKKGVSITFEPEDRGIMWMAGFEDLDGNEFLITQNK